MLRVEDIHKSFGKLHVLRGVNLNVDRGGVVCVIGPSGSGKSTLLRCINLLEPPDKGRIFLEGQEITSSGRAETDFVRRRVGIVFQQFNLFPHKKAIENVMIAQEKVLGRSREEARAKGLALLERVGLADKVEEYPDRLSGGQQQRVAIARALAGDRPLLLLDEPFAALDALTRERLQEDVRGVSERTGNTSVFVTHSVDEAVFLASRVVVLTKAPGTVALDVPVDLPRGGISADDLRGLPEYAALRAEIGAAVRSVAS
jgi:taurine transport system ATP-binding protein